LVGGGKTVQFHKWPAKRGEKGLQGWGKNWTGDTEGGVVGFPKKPGTCHQLGKNVKTPPLHKRRQAKRI